MKVEGSDWVNPLSRGCRDLLSCFLNHPTHSMFTADHARPSLGTPGKTRRPCLKRGNLADEPPKLRSATTADSPEPAKNSVASPGWYRRAQDGPGLSDECNFWRSEFADEEEKVMTVPSAFISRASWKQWNGCSRRMAQRSRRDATPLVEGLESRALLASITEYPITVGTQSLGNGLVGIAAGPDGNVYFTGHTSGITRSDKSLSRV